MTAKKKQKIKVTKTETINEYIARGGKVEKLPYIPPDDNQTIQRIRSTPPMPAHQMNLDEGAHYFAEKRKRNKKANYNNINMDLIPDNLKSALGVTDDKH